MNQIQIPIKAVFKNHPQIEWSKRTTCIDYGLEKDFRGLVLVESNSEVYYMDNRTVMYISTLQTLTNEY